MDISHKQYIENQLLKIAQILKDVIADNGSILLAARQIVRLRHEIDFDENDKDILVFIGIDSETDNLPIGQEKSHWNQEALKNKETEIVEAEKWALDFGIQACKNMLDKIKKSNT